MFSWNPLTISYQKQEFSLNPMFRDIAHEIARHLPEGKTVIDAGSGLGFLSKELSSEGLCVTAVENDPLAARESVFPATRADIHDLAPHPITDMLVCCSFGSILECLELARSLTDGLLCMVRRNQHGHRFRPDDGSPSPAVIAKTMLLSLGIPYEETFVPIEGGQHFRDHDDAAKFFHAYGIHELPSLEPCEGPFPLLYHKEDVASLFFIKKENIPDFRGKTTLVIEGKQGIGKTTLVTRLTEGYRGTLTGFLTRKRDGKVYISSLDGSLSGIAGNAGESTPKAFDSIGVQALRSAGELRIMDELGFMEREAYRFQDAVISAVSDEKPTIAVVKDRDLPFLSMVKEHERSLLVRLSEENRDIVTEELRRAVCCCRIWPVAKAITRRSSGQSRHR